MIADPTEPTNPSIRRRDRAEIERSMDACTKCGICHVHCPVASVTGDFPGPKYAGPQAHRFRAIEAIDETAPLLCTGCGICSSVCPNEVSIADLIAIARADGVKRGSVLPLGQRVLNRPDLIGAVAGLAPTATNWMLGNRLLRRAAEALAGIDRNAALPAIRGSAFRDWFGRRRQPDGTDVAYFSGCAVEHFDAEIGIAVVRVLNRLGLKVTVPSSACCALPMLSSGEWGPAEKRARKVVDDLKEAARSGWPIVASSTSCALALRSKYAAYLSFTDQDAARVANGVVDVCGFLRDHAIDRLRPRLKPIAGKCLYHGPCQLQSHQIGWPAIELLREIEGLRVEVSGASCCGIGGTYGFDRAKRPISLAIAGALLDQIEQSCPDFIVCDSETCRWHIADQSGLPCLHPVEVLIASLDGRHPLTPADGSS